MLPLRTSHGYFRPPNCCLVKQLVYLGRVTSGVENGQGCCWAAFELADHREAETESTTLRRKHPVLESTILGLPAFSRYLVAICQSSDLWTSSLPFSLPPLFFFPLPRECTFALTASYHILCSRQINYAHHPSLSLWQGCLVDLPADGTSNCPLTLIYIFSSPFPQEQITVLYKGSSENNPCKLLLLCFSRLFTDLTLNISALLFTHILWLQT